MKYSEWKASAGASTATDRRYIPREQIKQEAGNRTMTYSQWKCINNVNASVEPYDSQYNALKNSNCTSAKTINKYQKTMQSGGYLSTEDLTQFESALDTYSKTGNQLFQSYGTDNSDEHHQWQDTVNKLKSNYLLAVEYYSKFENENDYNQQRENAKRTEEMLAADLSALQSDLEEIRAIAEQYKLNDKQLKQHYLNPEISGISEHQAKAIDLWLQQIEGKYGIEDVSELYALVADKTAYISNAKRLQEWNAMEAVSDPTRSEYDPDFTSYTGYVSTQVSNRTTGYFDVDYDDFNGSQPGEANSGYADTVYEFINGNEEISEYLADIDNNYYFLSERERQIYNYYYATQGRNTAESYLSLLSDTLNYRAAKSEFKKIEGKTLQELAFAVEAGLNQFGSGISYLTNTEGAYMPTSKTQHLSGMVREDLADDSIPMWYNIKTGKWEDKVLGNSLGQISYDTISTTANMAPSLLATAAVGTVSKTGGVLVGGILTGASSSGNAYQQKLNMGYTQEQAAAYGLLVGVSEAVLDVALSKLGDIGGVITKPVLENLDMLDNVLAQFAKSVPGKILINAGDEAFEEYLQAALEPVLWGIISGEEMTVDQEDALYNALLGFISGGLSEGGTVISANIAQRTHATEATPNFVINHNNISSIDGKPNSPSSNTASDTVATLTGSLQSSPQTDVAVSGENTDNLSTRQVLAQAIENMGSRPMDPKTYNALFSYKNKLEQYNRTAALLAQAQQQSPGAAPSNVTQLKKLLVKQEARLAQAEGSPELQPIANKTRAEIVENNRKNVVDISRIFDRIKAEGDIITDGSHIENGKLKPNVTYQTGEYDYLYQTDGMGRICRAIAKHLKRKMPGTRKDHYRKTPGKLPGDEAGHLIADRFGGSRKLDNLVSQAKDVNHKEFGHLENLWAKAIAQGKEVSVDIQVFYDGDGKRPVGFQIDYAIDGVPANANIVNDNGGVTNNG